MKAVLIFILAIFINSCCGTQQAIETQPEPSKEIAIVTEVPDAVPTERENDDGEINEMIEVVDNKGNTVGEVSSEEEANELIENKKKQSDSIQFISDDRFTFIHDNWGKLLQKHVSIDGKVDYSGFKRNRNELSKYIKSLAKTTTMDNWSKEDKLAYWINAYNALTIDLIIRNYPLETIKDIKDPWDQRLWKFGDKWQNLNDIEHKILRKMNEPRIHFAIVCASESCPKLLNKAFTSENLEEQLAKVTTDFLSDTSKNELSKNRIKLSKIFKWFKKDFEQDGNLIDFLNQYSDITISNSAKKSYKDYSWELND